METGKLETGKVYLYGKSGKKGKSGKTENEVNMQLVKFTFMENLEKRENLEKQKMRLTCNW
jgi:hypothetical protein